ncbi:MAG: hypothetical protein JWL75_144 [Parcubacteria group bacterium]|nr:hypothetical protein [Parcubacteria group bacterium]
MMMFSNVFLLLPAVFAGVYHQWLYFFFALGLCIFSPLYHWHQIHRYNSQLFHLNRRLDLAFAVGAFIYMFYWISQYGQYKIIFTILLLLMVIFFLYGRRKDYKRFHPWFHILAPILSSAILIVAHI